MCLTRRYLGVRCDAQYPPAQLRRWVGTLDHQLHEWVARGRSWLQSAIDIAADPLQCDRSSSHNALARRGRPDSRLIRLKTWGTIDIADIPG